MDLWRHLKLISHIANSSTLLQLFQGQKKPPAPKPAESASSGPSLPSIGLPSVSLPSVGLPSVGLPSLPTPDLSGLNVSPSGGIDPRTIALPGEAHSLFQSYATHKLPHETVCKPSGSIDSAPASSL